MWKLTKTRKIALCAKLFDWKKKEYVKINIVATELTRAKKKRNKKELFLASKNVTKDTTSIVEM